MKVIDQFQALAALPLGKDPGVRPDVSEKRQMFFPSWDLTPWIVHFVANHYTYWAISAPAVKSNIQLQYAFLYNTRCIK